ncbi:arabinose efflux permease family protein [Halovivax ruber XH-70]|uniref:Arabinose efflux permease family protein n=1 Tax=Halovivax ruber (strain DSM 18193 / JCM 13892 / XH-70) TaxID=797302 RepID=L0IBV8_HALRX|nr:MFS transporter [Halovivax ruber]AGB17060.1 arabinose efflux permease family protein [Halovivax ruber XH-70]
MSASTGRERSGVPWRSRVFWTVLASTVVVPLGVPLVSSLLPLMRDAFAVSDVRAGYVLSIYFVPGIFLSPLIGRLLDRVGRRPVLLGSLVSFGVVGAIIPFLGGFTLVLGARLGQGVAAAGIFVTTVTIVADAFEGPQRNTVFGINVAILSTGRTLYPVLGGTLALYGWKVPFACYLLAVGAALFVAREFEESADTNGSTSVDDSTERATIRRAIGELSVRRTIQLYGATILAETVVFGTLMTTLPFLLARDFDASAATIGAVIATAMLASAAVAAANGHLAQRYANRSLVALGFCCFGLGLLGIGVASSLRTIDALAFVFGVGIGLVLPSVDAAISRSVSAASNASAMSLRNSATGLGRASGPILFTGLATQTGYRSLFTLTGVATLALGLGFLVLRRARTSN